VAIRERNLPKARALLDASPVLLHTGDTRGNQAIHWAGSGVPLNNPAVPAEGRGAPALILVGRRMRRFLSPLRPTGLLSSLHPQPTVETG
jgi:hypothetical protein